MARIAEDAFRVLTFRQPSSAIATEWKSYLAFGLVFTWLAGVGRYWDSPRAALWQHLGLGSVVYVFALALILWVLLIPLRPTRWSYSRVLVFVALTSPPALLYAIPVERFMPMREAQSVNAWFLAIVAAWRVGLLVWFLRGSARLSGGAIVVATLLPLTLIVVALTTLNLEHVVFDIMAGIRPEDRSPNDTAYFVVMIMAYFSIMAAPLLVAGYGWLAYRARVTRNARRALKSSSSGSPMTLPPDIAARLAAQFPADRGAVALSHLNGIPHVTPRIARCVVHLANGNLADLAHYAEAAKLDLRDVIFWAEYEDHEADRPRLVRDMEQPFDE